MNMSSLPRLVATVLLGACQASPAAARQDIATTDFGWFVPQGVRVQTLGEVSSRRQVIDATHRSTEILFSNPSGNPDTESEPVLAVRFLMRIDCETGNYRLTERSWLGGSGLELRTIPVDVPENFMGPMNLVIDEVCGGAPAPERAVFTSVADYVVQSGSRPRAPVARLVSITPAN